MSLKNVSWYFLIYVPCLDFCLPLYVVNVEIIKLPCNPHLVTKLNFGGSLLLFRNIYTELFTNCYSHCVADNYVIQMSI